jgi:hypothetical protein
MWADWWRAHKAEVLLDAAVFTAAFVGFGVWTLWKLLRKRGS